MFTISSSRARGAMLAACAALLLPAGAHAQSAPAASGRVLVLVPFEGPATTDSHGPPITQTVAATLTAQGDTIKTVAPMDHLDAVTQAAALCSANGAVGIVIPEGRFEQTRKVIPAPFVTVLRYPTHAEIRLDEIACDGGLRRSTTGVGDTARTGAFSVGNLGSAVDEAFRDAIAIAGASFATTPASGALVLAPAPAAAIAPSTVYVEIPFQQPQVDDPYGEDLSRSLFEHLQKHSKVTVTLGKPVDHLAVISTASAICAAAGAGAIVVPDVRIEQSTFTGRSHSELRLALVSCDGRVLAKGTSEADMGNGFIVNFGSAVTGVTERALDPALDMLFAPPGAAASQTPSPVRP